MVQDVSVDQGQLRLAIQNEYSEVASNPDKGFHFHVGRIVADRLGYPKERVAALPDAVVESFAGVGYPFAWGEPAPGATVLDQGSGAGLDALLAAQMVGPTGQVIGIDMTREMLDKAGRNAQLLGLENIVFCEGYLESLPVASDSVDLVITNGVVNLCPDKRAVIGEAYRVLKPGGRYQLTDIVVGRAVPEGAKTDISLWTGCIAGALIENELRQVLEAAGFEDVTFAEHRYDVYGDAPGAASADAFETKGVDILALKPSA